MKEQAGMTKEVNLVGLGNMFLLPYRLYYLHTMLSVKRRGFCVGNNNWRGVS